MLLKINFFQHVYLFIGYHFVENPLSNIFIEYYYSTIFAEGRTDEYCVIEDSNHTIIGYPDWWRKYLAMVGHLLTAFSEKFKGSFRTEFKHEPYREQLWEDHGRHVKELL